MMENNDKEERPNRSRSGSGGGGGGGGGGQRRYVRRPRVCAFCLDKTQVIDYKSHDMLRRYVTEHGRIRPRRQTGVCAKHQRGLAKSIKQARHIALLPFVAD